MGQRANLIIATKESYELYYNHWCANTITEDLFWGPQHAVNFITMQQKVDKENGWLGDVWAEGEVVLDIERKVLLIYGGEEIKYDVPLRRIYLKPLSKIWIDWDIRWAYEGIADLADYVGYPREKILTQDDGHFRAEVEAVCGCLSTAGAKLHMYEKWGISGGNQGGRGAEQVGSCEDRLEMSICCSI